MNYLKSLTSAAMMAVIVLSSCKPAPERGAEPADKKTETVQSVTPVAPATPMLSPLGGGEPIPLSRWADRNALLVFFAPWTDSSHAVIDWISSFPAEGVEIIPVVVDRSAAADQEVTKPLAGINRTVYLADDLLVQASGGIRVLPTAVWLKGGDTVAGRWEGVPSFTGVVDVIAGRTLAP